MLLPIYWTECVSWSVEVMAFVMCIVVVSVIRQAILYHLSEDENNMQI